jgi:hypothetical protein
VLFTRFINVRQAGVSNGTKAMILNVLRRLGLTMVGVSDW